MVKQRKFSTWNEAGHGLEKVSLGPDLKGPHHRWMGKGEERFEIVDKSSRPQHRVAERGQACR